MHAPVPAVTRTDIFNLDFTAPAALDNADEQQELNDIATTARDTMQKLEQLIGDGCREEAAWRMLASLYLGTDNFHAFNELEERHEREFGAPIFPMLHQPRSRHDENREVFQMPTRITAGVLPPVEEVLNACASDDGAALDFSRVRGADGAGLQELAGFLARMPHNADRPEMPGIDRFMGSLIKAAESASGTRTMWDVLFTYQRLLGDEKSFDELAIKFAVKFGVSPPSFDRGSLY